MAKPPVACTFQLVEDGNYLYQPVAARRKGAPGLLRVDVLLQIRRDPPAPDPKKAPTLLLDSLTVSFPGTKKTRTYPVARAIDKDTFVLDASMSSTTDIILLDAPAPAKMKITLSFKGFDPLDFVWPLKAHHSPTRAGSYAFPFKASDLGSDPNGRYVTTGIHKGGQMFHNDYKIVGWDAALKQFVSNPGKTIPQVMHGQLIDDACGKNEDHLLWDVPIYAGADGFVLKAEDVWPDNPRPLQSSVYTSTAMPLPEKSTVLAVEECGSARVITVISDATNHLRMMSHRTGKYGKSLTFEGISEPTTNPLGQQSMTTAKVSSTQVVTAGHNKDSSVLMLWSVKDGGANISQTDSLPLKDTRAIKIRRMGTGRLVMARQPKTGNFELSIWDIGSSSFPAKAATTTHTGGPTILFDVAALGDLKGRNDPERFVTAALTHAGNLKVTVWDLSISDMGKLEGVSRGGSLDTGDRAQEISVCMTSLTSFVVSTRTTSGMLRLYFFTIDKNRVISQLAVVDPDEKVSHVTIRKFKGGVSTSVRTSKGTFRLIGWAIKPNEPVGEEKIRRAFTVDDPMKDITGIVQSNVFAPEQNATVAVGLTSLTGSPRLLLCTLGGPNTLYTLSGNEVMMYAHYKSGTLTKKFLQPGALVKKGELIARAGSSGQSDNPHLHVGVERLDLTGLTGANGSVSEAQKKVIIERFAADKIPNLHRGMPFHGVSATLTGELLPGGVAKNKFEVVDDQAFSQGYAVHPAPLGSA